MFCDVGSRKLFEDIIRHGSHDILWHYKFKRDVDQYRRITSNHKTNKISYTFFYLRHCFPIMHINIQGNVDGLLTDSKDLLEIYKYVKVPRYSYKEPAENKRTCHF